jgi:hypothetical protein
VRTNSFRPLVALIVLVLGMSSGCGTSTTDAQPSTRLEHHQAAHHPTSYAAAINELERRDGRIQTALRDVPSETLQREIKEMLDILEWLPAIAADTDLKQRDWETVKKNATQLIGIYASFATAENAGNVSTDVSRDACRRTIQSLRDLVPASDRRL